MRRARGLTAVVVVLAGTLIASRVGEAHKPITSPFTYNEDVFPILRDHCGSCHVAGGVAPMSLMTYADAVPWGESMRAELIAGHMPPWPVGTSRDHFRNVGGLTARELNVLLTWATGGTPPGDPAKAPSAMTRASGWPLGKPDLELELDPVTIAAGTSERTVLFAVATGTRTTRLVRAIDLLPGDASVVRSALISIKGTDDANGDAIHRERLVSLWQPGERPGVSDAAGFELSAESTLDVVVRYKKTWQYERKEMHDQSRIGIYFAESSAAPIEALTLSASVDRHSLTALQQPAVGDRPATTAHDMRVVAAYPDPKMSRVRVTVDVIRPDGSRADVIALRAQSEWVRRYWFKEPLLIPKGSTVSLHVSPIDEIEEPSPAASSASPDRAPAVTLNVIGAP